MTVLEHANSLTALDNMDLCLGLKAAKSLCLNGLQVKPCSLLTFRNTSNLMAAEDCAHT